MKYWGQLRGVNTSCIIIFRLTSNGNINICYNPTTYQLNFNVGTTTLFTDTTFTSYIGQWVLISYSGFVNNPPNNTGLMKYYGHLYRFYVHNKQIPANANTSVPAPGLVFNTLDIGYEFSAIFADLRIYRNFIVNPYGHILSTIKSNSLAYYLPLSTTDLPSNGGKCIAEGNIKSSYYLGVQGLSVTTESYYTNLGVSCQADYSPYLSGLTCNVKNFYDITQFSVKNPPCYACDTTCTGNCSTSDKSSCTCDLNTADNWLRMDSTTNNLTCEPVPQMEFSKTGTTTITNVQVAKNKEYTTEFWFYLYTYDISADIAFDSHEMIWNLHNHITIYNSNNLIKVKCLPVFNSNNSNSTAYQAVSSEDSLTNGLKRWVYVTCSTDVSRGLYYLNTGIENAVTLDKALLPDLTNISSTTLVLQPGNNARTNYGFLFIREIKLWSIYDVRLFTSICK